ncbi:MAG: hypothetical protein IMZ61_04495, partial [Planctomycetes bacterium]|nr:hypothetical protein [Planctomycetota bacterium]
MSDIKLFKINNGQVSQIEGQAVGVENGKNTSFSPTKYVSEFSESMENDLGTPGALHALQGLAQGILEAAKGQRDVKEAQEMLR